MSPVRAFAHAERGRVGTAPTGWTRAGWIEALLRERENIRLARIVRAARSGAPTVMPAELHRRVVLGIGKPLPRRAPSLALKLLMILLAIVAACVLGSLATAQGDGGVRPGALAGLERSVETGEKVAPGALSLGTTPLEKLEIVFARRALSLRKFFHIFSAPLPPSAGSPQRNGVAARPRKITQTTPSSPALTDLTDDREPTANPVSSKPEPFWWSQARVSLPRIPIAGLPDSAPLTPSISGPASLAIPEWVRSLSVSAPAWDSMALRPNPCRLSRCNSVDLAEPAPAAIEDGPCFMTPGGCLFSSRTWGWIGVVLAACIAVLFVLFLVACYSGQATASSEDKR